MAVRTLGRFAAFVGLTLTLAALVPASPTAAHVPRPAATHVTFRSADGITLRGHLWAGGSTAVVFSHMYGTTESIWFDLAGVLAAQGYTVLTFDFRGAGRSSGRLVIARVYRDTLAAVQFIRTRRPQRIVLVGASMGGTASIVAAGQTKVDGLIVIASGMRFRGLDVRPYLGMLRMPKLFIVGSRDAPFHQSVRMMYDLTLRPKQLLVVPTALHGTYMFQIRRHREAIYAAITGSLRGIAAGK